jgi:hypothetical protein
MEDALKKLLKTMLKDEYPQIKDIVVYSTDLMGTGTTYRVGLGIKYNDLFELGDERLDILKDEVKYLSKYLLGKNEYFEQTFFYDPNDSN